MGGAGEFVLRGRGTPAPRNPPRELVTSRLYRITRNPMYVGIICIVAGWGLYWASPEVLIYAGMIAIAFHLRVVHYEGVGCRSSCERPLALAGGAVLRPRPLRFGDRQVELQLHTRGEGQPQLVLTASHARVRVGSPGDPDAARSEDQRKPEWPHD